MNQESYREIFYNDGYSLLKNEVKDDELTKETMFLALEKMYESIDVLIDSLIAMAQKQGINVACHKGCEWCCHQAVFANSYEIHYLAEFIQKNFPEEKKRAIIQQAQNKSSITDQLDETQVLNYKSPCPMLENGCCSAYSARPMACRIYLSTKLESCLEFYKNPANETNYPALLDFPLIAGKNMNEGFIEALKDQEILIEEFRLEKGLSIFFQ